MVPVIKNARKEKVRTKKSKETRWDEHNNSKLQ